MNSEYFTDPSAKPAFFNDLPDWEYNQLASGLGVETFMRVRTNHELEAALAKLGGWSAGPVLIEVVIPGNDLPSGLRQTLV